MAFNSNTLAKARQLCSPEGERMMDTMKGKGGISSAYFDDNNHNYINESQMRERNPNYNNNNGGQRKLSDLNIPDVVKESFANQTIDVSSLADPATQNMRAFDDIIEAFTKDVETTKQPLREETIYTSQQTQHNPNTFNGGIDYNLIRQIVEECIDRKFKTLNESSLKSIKLKEGKITLAANNGNVFSANLEYKGNLNDKKK